jgi:hypothetical protein
MSSIFYSLCLSHDPALPAGELYGGEGSNMRRVLADDQGEHKGCDMVIQRVSGAPVEFGCPGIRKDICGGHSSIQWIDADVLRLLCHIRDDDRIGIKVLRTRPLFRCWTNERLHRLRYDLGVVGWEN